MSDQATTTLIDRITFGPAAAEWDTNDIASGGWINVSMAVMLDGREIGTANIGCWVYVGSGTGCSADVYDEVRRTGWAIRAYRGSDRNFALTDSDAWAAALSDDDDPDELEDAILDAADDSHATDDVDYEDIVRAAYIARLPEWRDDPVILADGADTQHADAEEMYDALGFSTDHTLAHSHPVCAIGEIESFEPSDDNERALLDYARDAAEAMRGVEGAMDDAVAAYKLRDLRGVIEALEDAARAEREYGDDPDTRTLAGRLLASAEDELTHSIIAAALAPPL